MSNMPDIPESLMSVAQNTRKNTKKNNKKEPLNRIEEAVSTAGAAVTATPAATCGCNAEKLIQLEAKIAALEGRVDALYRRNAVIPIVSGPARPGTPTKSGRHGGLF